MMKSPQVFLHIINHCAAFSHISNFFSTEICPALLTSKFWNHRKETFSLFCFNSHTNLVSIFFAFFQLVLLNCSSKYPSNYAIQTYLKEFRTHSDSKLHLKCIGRDIAKQVE